jgi:hypothetical protein
MAMEIYSTAALVAVVQNMLTPGSFLLDMFFPNAVYSDTATVAIDVFVGKRRLAPFVNPLRESRFVESLGFSTTEFVPPTIKDKRRLDPMRAVRRAIGERIGGGLTPQERSQANLGLELEDQLGMVTRRMEWMAANALASSAVTIVGDGYQAATIAYGRNSGQTIALSGGARWGQAGVYPTNDLDTWALLVQRNSGRTVTDVVFTPGSWAPFRADPRVSQIIGSLVNGNPNFQAAGVRSVTGGMALGTWGPYRLWMYNDWYVDPTDNVEKPMLTDGTIILGSQDLQGTRAFGVILDEDIGFPVQGFAPKSWVEKDPGVRWLLMQSAPLVIPTNVNAALAATVI